jgi:chromosome segregation ATPase
MSLNQCSTLTFCTLIDHEFTHPIVSFCCQSSILCAICLGLGGEPRLLGRASEVETFVMNGEDEGQIEIEIVNTKGRKNPIITRTIRRGKGGNKNAFTWNGKQITGKQVREKCLKEYDITVDNLCTFLPQDRVGSFSGFDSKQLLIETEKSLSSSQHLYHMHQQLIQDQMELNGGDSQVETLKDRIEQLKNETRRFEREKERMEEREAAVKQAELLEKKLMWLEFDNCRKEAYDLKGLRQEKKRAMLELAQQSEPLEKEHTRLAESLKNQEQTYKALDKEVQKHQKEMKKQCQKYEMHDDAIESILSDLNALDSARENQRQKVKQLREKVAEAEERIDECNTVANLEEDLRAAQEERKQVHPLYLTAKEEARKLSDQGEELQGEKKVQEGRWRQLQDEKAQRRGNIFRQQPNLKKVHDWLQQNRNRFRKEVVGPVCCEITPKSRNTAAYVEMHVANNTLKAFVVQTKDDYDLLYRSIRQELKTPISIILVDRIDPNPRRVYSPEKMNTLKQDHGVLGYMDESFTAPAVVMEALRSRHAIHKVLIGSDKTQESMDTRDLSNVLSTPQGYCIFTSQGEKSFQYTSSVSKYSGKSNLRVDDVRPAKWLAPGVSDARKQQVKDELDKCEKDLEAIWPAVEECRNNVQTYQVQEQQTLERIKLAKDNIGKLRKFITRKKNNERKLQEEEAKLSVDSEDEKKNKVEKLNGRIRASLQALDAHAESFKKVLAATAKCSGVRLNNEIVAVQERRAR